eukprot:PhM_4_TR15268/c3_g1_i7/m.55891
MLNVHMSLPLLYVTTLLLVATGHIDVVQADDCSVDDVMALRYASKTCDPTASAYVEQATQFAQIECQCMGGDWASSLQSCSYGPLGVSNDSPKHLTCDAMPCAIKLLEARRALARLRTQYGDAKHCSDEDSVINKRIDDAVAKAAVSFDGCSELLCSLSASFSGRFSECPDSTLMQATCDAIVKYEAAHKGTKSSDVIAIVHDKSVSIANSDTGSDQCMNSMPIFSLSSVRSFYTDVWDCHMECLHNRTYSILSATVWDNTIDGCGGTDSFNYPMKQMTCDGMYCAMNRLYRQHQLLRLSQELEPSKCTISIFLIKTLEAAVNASVTNMTVCKALLCELRWYSCTDETVLHAACLAMHKSITTSTPPLPLPAYLGAASNDRNASSGASVGIIVGAVVGACAVVGVAVGLVVWHLKKRSAARGVVHDRVLEEELPAAHSCQES